jgi:transcriptional regulator with XRE-family HTH domain
VCTHRLHALNMGNRCRSTSVFGFGSAIRRIRQEQDINQEEAAERCGLHQTYYSGVERGVRNVSLVNVEKIARGLKTAPPDIFRRL